MTYPTVPAQPVPTANPAWRDLLGRLWRQALQTALPLVQQTLSADGGGIDFRSLALSLAGSEAITLLKFVTLAAAGVNPAAAANPYVRAADRVLPAVVGVLTGLGVSDAASLTSINWSHAVVAAATAGVLALVSHGLDPAATAQST